MIINLGRKRIDLNVFGVGHIGLGSYKSSENGINSIQYTTWIAMMQRCYSEIEHKRHPTYIECSVAEEWLNFQNFAKWYDQNFYHIEGQKISLDKDILIKGNKIYSPDTCIFVPQIINTLFTKANVSRGQFPIGVSFNRNRFASRCRNEKGEQINIGRYNTPEEAFQAYKIFKETTIKNVAEKYKDSIPSKLYEAMITYEVSIED